MEYIKRVQEIIKEDKRLLLSLSAAGIFFLIAGCVYGLFGHGTLYFDRNLPGGGTNDVKVRIAADGDAEEKNLEIMERRYQREELPEAFEQGFSYVKEALLKDNPSLYEIRDDVGIIWSVPGTPFSVSWEFEDESILDMEGKVHNEDWVDETRFVHVLATLSYDDEEIQEKKSRVYTLKICPKNRSKAQQKIYEAWKKLVSSENASRTKDKIVVPSKISGAVIRVKGKRNPFFLCGGLLIFASVMLVLRRLEAKQKQEEEKRKAAKLLYPDILWQFVLFLEAGHTVPMAWTKIVDDYAKRGRDMAPAKRYVFEQMAYTKRQMDLGMSYEKAFAMFSQNMKLKCYAKLMTLFTQNMTKGSKNMLEILKEEEQQAFFERCEEAKRQGEETDTKLLLPMGIMLLNILLLLMVPAYMQFV